MEKTTDNSPRQVPTTALGKKDYFNERLRQSRNADNPHDFVGPLDVYKREPFVLIGTYQHRMNIEIIAMSDNPANLESISDAILELNSVLEGKDRNLSDPEVVRLIENQLCEINTVDDMTEFVYEIDVIGIFKMAPVSNCR